MRVVQVNPVHDPRLRTGEEVLAAWPAVAAAARASAAAGFETTVVQAHRRDELFIDADGIHYWFVGDPGRLLRRVRGARAALVHWQGLESRAVRMLAGRARVVVQDHSGFPAAGWRRPVQRWALARIDGAIFSARGLAETYFAAGVLRPGLPVFEAHESTSWFTPGEVDEARRKTGIGGDPCLLWLGHLDANKDPLAILHAVSLASRALPGIRLWMAYGTAPLEAEVRARLAADPALAARVTLLGRVPHARVETLCRAADLFVQGSGREASSYALTESLACGCTPLLSDIPAFRRMTADGAVGGLFPRGDAEALARLIVGFAARDRAALRRAARAHFDLHLSPAALSRDLGAAYRAVLGR